MAGLVAALHAPAEPGELDGLDVAIAAFTVAPRFTAPQEKTPMLKSVAGRLLALKIAAVAAGVALTGGVAYAAATGDLGTPTAGPADSSSAAASSGAPSSEPGTDDSSSQSGSASDSSSGSEGSSGSEDSSGSESSSASESDSSSAPGSEGVPTPSLHGLCTAWLAHPRDIAKVSGNPAFSVLIKAAGGADSVNGYCTSLLASTHPTHPAKPSHSKKPAPPQSNRSHTKSHPGGGTSSSKTKKPHPTQARDTKSPNPHAGH